MTDDLSANVSRRSVLKMGGASLAAAGTGVLGSASAYRYDCDDDPEAPSNLTAKRTTDYSVTLSWDAPTDGDVDHYVVSAGNRDDSRYGPYMHRLLKEIDIWSGYDTYEVTGLPPSRSLVFDVRAVHTDGTESGSCQTTASTDAEEFMVHDTCDTPTKSPCTTWNDETQNDMGGRWGYDNHDEVTISDEHGIELDYEEDTGNWWTKFADEYGNLVTIDDHENKEIRMNVVAPSGYDEIHNARLTWNHCDDVDDTDCGGALSDRLSYFDRRRYPDTPAGQRQTLYIPLQAEDRGGNVLWDVERPGEFKLEFGRYSDDASKLRITEMWVSE